MRWQNFTVLKSELQIKTKKRVDFILAASIIWMVVGYIWTFEYTSYNKSVLTFIIGSGMLPLAFVFSKVFKTQWMIKDNPLQPLGLWLNFAQLFYFPILIFVMIKNPDYFILTYAIITGAHLFPYAWLFDEIRYAVCAGTISIGSLVIALMINESTMWIIPLVTSILLFILAGCLFLKIKITRTS